MKTLEVKMLDNVANDAGCRSVRVTGRAIVMERSRSTHEVATGSLADRCASSVARSNMARS
jgi:hypothetical protein